jgi:hypothetical protein
VLPVALALILIDANRVLMKAWVASATPIFAPLCLPLCLGWLIKNASREDGLSMVARHQRLPLA